MFVIPATAKSWVSVDSESHFPIQNLPFGLVCTEDGEETVAVRIGDYALDLCELSAAGLIPEDDFCIVHSLIDLDRDDLWRLRRLCFELLEGGSAVLRDNAALREKALVPVERLEMLVPLEIPAFVDFYSGINHASNVGKMFRPNMPALLPNYRHLPVAYNGRASSVYVSGTEIRRPKGQIVEAGQEAPTFGATRELDFELEMGFFLAEGNAPGEPISTSKADDHILGFVLVNDWSARDMQRWEYQPLGPFLAKSFATSISPWIVTPDALEPFRREGPIQEPAPLPHLTNAGPSHYDILLEVALQPSGGEEVVISRTNARELYWSFAQQLAHATSNGTHVEPGDLYASGTISGSEPGTYGSMLELSWKGTQPVKVGGVERTFLEDGDTVVMRGYAQGDGYRVGFGEVVGTVIAAG